MFTPDNFRTLYTHNQLKETDVNNQSSNLSRQRQHQRCQLAAVLLKRYLGLPVRPHSAGNVGKDEPIKGATMKRALGYARVSGKTQANEGTGLEEQRAQCEAWAAHNGYEIVQWFEDAGVSGELPWDKRPAMRALVERVALNGIDAVIVHQLDRLTRGKAAVSEDFLAVVAASGVQVISTIDGVLTDVEGDEFQVR
jgi:predicted site-specific integrase-resolvase